MHSGSREGLRGGEWIEGWSKHGDNLPSGGGCGAGQPQAPINVDARLGGGHVPGVQFIECIQLTMDY